MKQVVQPIGGGPVEVLDVPRPTAGPTEVLVQTLASIISPGTERAVTSLAQSSLYSKARARPDLVRQVVKKARQDGLATTLQTVRAKLASDVPLGYSAAGIAVAVGEAVSGVHPGQLVATGGAGKANHAEWQAVPGLLCVGVPDGVAPQDAAFTTIAAIALHGLRLAEVGPGSKVVVVGLGLVGQLCARLARAAGCDVVGIDVAAMPLERAAASGVLAVEERGDSTTSTVMAWSRGRGADAVLLCAAGASSAAVRRAPALCRDRARVVVVGDIGLDIARTPFYEKELSLLFARSYGPGRYEREYEEYAVDYPAGQVRWTEGRNFEAVLDLIAAGRLALGDLVTHQFPIAEAERAYELVETRREPHLAIALTYPTAQQVREPAITLKARAGTSGRAGVGWIGAGAYSTAVLLPAFESAGFDRLVSVASATGLSARRVAERSGFEKAVGSADEVIDDPDVEIVVVATPHDTHAEYVVKALSAGKHVWCEKPVALTLDELERVESAWRSSGQVLQIGYNRRWAPALLEVSKGLSRPAVITYRVSAGRLPGKHWYGDRRQGGRLLGEVCHFVDACSALLRSAVVDVQVLLRNDGELLLADDVVLSLRHEDGSLSSITYTAAGHPSTPKERIDILAGDESFVIDDWREVSRNGKSAGRKKQDKGQGAAVRAFREGIQSGTFDTEALLSSSRATLMAAAAAGRQASVAADELGG